MKVIVKQPEDIYVRGCRNLGHIVSIAALEIKESFLKKKTQQQIYKHVIFMLKNIIINRCSPF